MNKYSNSLFGFYILSTYEFMHASWFNIILNMLQNTKSFQSVIESLKLLLSLPLLLFILVFLLFFFFFIFLLHMTVFLVAITLVGNCSVYQSGYICTMIKKIHAWWSLETLCCASFIWHLLDRHTGELGWVTG